MPSRSTGPGRTSATRSRRRSGTARGRCPPASRRGRAGYCGRRPRRRGRRVGRCRPRTRTGCASSSCRRSPRRRAGRQRAPAERVLLQLGGQRQHLGLLVRCQVVVAQEVLVRSEASPLSAAVSRIAGSAVRKLVDLGSVMISGGASRMTSGAAALTRKPASRAAVSTALALRGGQHDAAQQPAAPDVVDQRMAERLDAVAAASCRARRHGPPGRRSASTRSTASAAAVQTGLPPKVLPCRPGCQQVGGRTDGQARADRQAAAETLGQRDDVGGDAVVLVGEERAGAARCRSAPRRAPAARRGGGDLARGGQVARRAGRRRRPPP